jgi:hypothetical protein
VGVALFLATPWLVFADTQQLDSSGSPADFAATSGPFHIQKLGTGMSGTLTTMVLSLYNYDYFNHSVVVTMYECSSYGTQCGTVFDTSNTVAVNGTTPVLTTFTFSGLSVDPTKYYYFIPKATNDFHFVWAAGSDSSSAYPSGAVVTTSNFTSSSTAPYALYFDIAGMGTSAPDTRTRIDSTTPANNATIASSTSSTFGGVGYVSVSDYVASNTYFNFCTIKATAQVGSDIFAPVLAVQQGACVSKTYDLPITASGSFTVSTTTDTSLMKGAYVMKSSIHVPWFNLFGFSFGSRSLVSTSTVFVVATSTRADAQALGRLQILEGLDSTALSGDYNDPCANLPGSTTECLIGIVVPTGQDFSQLKADFDSIISIGPWGFLGNTYLTLSGAYYVPNSTTLPAITANFSDLHMAGATDNTTITLSPWNVLASTSIASTATSPKDGKTFRDITETGWTMFVLAMFAFAIFNELVGVGGKAVSAD